MDLVFIFGILVIALVIAPIAMTIFLGVKILKKDITKLKIIIFLLSLIVSIWFYASLMQEIKFYINPSLGQDYMLNDLDEYRIHKDSKKINIPNIIEYEYNDNYIIAQRIPAQYFICKDKVEEMVYVNNIEYVIIDKNKDKIYTTMDKSKFLQFIKRMHVDLELHLENQALKDEIEENNKNFYKYNDTEVNNINRTCKPFTKIGNAIKL